MTTKFLAGLAKAMQEIETVLSESFTKAQIFVKIVVVSDSDLFVHLNREFLMTGIDPLEKEMATHSSILARKIPWVEEPDRLQSMGLQRVVHNRVTSLSFL